MEMFFIMTGFKKLVNSSPIIEMKKENHRVNIEV